MAPHPFGPLLGVTGSSRGCALPMLAEVAPHQQGGRTGALTETQKAPLPLVTIPGRETPPDMTHWGSHCACVRCAVPQCLHLIASSVQSICSQLGSMLLNNETLHSPRGTVIMSTPPVSHFRYWLRERKDVGLFHSLVDPCQLDGEQHTAGP